MRDIGRRLGEVFDVFVGKTIIGAEVGKTTYRWA
jgi:hypothetical protein